MTADELHIHNCPRCDDPVALPVPVQGDPTRAMAVKLANMMKCATCIDTELRQEATSHSVRIADDRDRRAHYSGLPIGLRGLSWDHMRREQGRDKVIDAAFAWTQEGGSFFLSGRPGPGKTRLAATACWQLLSDGHAPKWAQTVVLLTKANSDFGSDSRAEAEKVLLGKGPLFLDDLGKESDSPLSRQLLQAALDERLENKQRVFITSNFTAPQLGAHHGDWLASRLARFEQWDMPGPDLRLV